MAFGRLDAAEDRVVDVNAIIGGVGGVLSHLVGDQIELSASSSRICGGSRRSNRVEQVLMNPHQRPGRDAARRPSGARNHQRNGRQRPVEIGRGYRIRHGFVRSQRSNPLHDKPDAGLGSASSWFLCIVADGQRHHVSAPDDGTTFMIDLPSLGLLQPVA
jgi:hypothetical protein